MQLLSFLKKDFVKNVLTLLTGSALSQVIVYAAMLLLTRLFSKELFGVYVLFSSIVLILKPIISLQLELIILLPKKDKDAANSFVLSILVLLLTVGIVAFAIFIFKPYILSFFEIQILGNFIYLIPVSCFLLGCINSLDYLNNRLQLFKKIASGNIIKSSVMSTTQIATGFTFLNSFGLIPGVIIGQFGQVVFLFKTSYKFIALHKNQISFHKMRDLLKTYKDIPIYNTLLSFSNTLSNELPVLLITKYFGLSYAGMYGLTIKISKGPLGVILNPVKQVFYNKASESYNNHENLHLLIKNTCKHLLKIAFLVFGVLFSISFFLDIILGEKWTDVGFYVRILSPWLFVIFFSYPISSLSIILNKQKIILLLDVFLLIFRFLAFYIGYHYYNNLIIALSLFSLIGVVFNAFILFYYFRITKKHPVSYHAT